MEKKITRISLIFQVFNQLPNGTEFTVRSLWDEYLKKLAEEKNLSLTINYVYNIITLLRNSGYCSKPPKISKTYSKIKCVETNMTLTDLQIKSKQIIVDNGKE
jgi:hypothetical protein